MYKFNC